MGARIFDASNARLRGGEEGRKKEGRKREGGGSGRSRGNELKRAVMPYTLVRMDEISDASKLVIAFIEQATSLKETFSQSAEPLLPFFGQGAHHNGEELPQQILEFMMKKNGNVLPVPLTTAGCKAVLMKVDAHFCRVITQQHGKTYRGDPFYADANTFQKMWSKQHRLSSQAKRRQSLKRASTESDEKNKKAKMGTDEASSEAKPGTESEEKNNKAEMGMDEASSETKPVTEKNNKAMMGTDGAACSASHEVIGSDSDSSSSSSSDSSDSSTSSSEPEPETGASKGPTQKLTAEAAQALAFRIAPVDVSKQLAGGQDIDNEAKDEEGEDAMYVLPRRHRHRV
eukprot:12431489-Karenia_brevis.AAC.1